MTDKWDVNQNMIDLYLQACTEFVKNDDAFNNFKQDPRYTPVLEHVSIYEANLYYSEMRSKNLITKTILNSVKENDKYGSPSLFEHSELGSISPTTVRYLKNTLDILDHFGKDGKYTNIVEIGGGYGGLCKVFSSFVNFENYHLIDLPEVSIFSRKYLNNFRKLKDRVQYITADNLTTVDNIDLLISNYAFSECTRECQLNYYNSYIKKADKFYMMYNQFTPNNIPSEDFIDIVSNDFSLEVRSENRGTHSNLIIYGNKKNNEN